VPVGGVLPSDLQAECKLTSDVMSLAASIPAGYFAAVQAGS